MAITTCTATSASSRSCSFSISVHIRDVRSTFMSKPPRLLAVAAALMTTLWAGVASAQTVMIRNAPPSSSIDVMLNGKSVGTGTTNDEGEVTVPLVGTGIDSKVGVDANIFVDVCDK